jgi:hypothetical protein
VNPGEISPHRIKKDIFESFKQLSCDVFVLDEIKDI